MLLQLAIVGAAFLQPVNNERPPRPTDDQLLAALVLEAPAARVLSSEFRDTPRAGGRIGCGLVEIHGKVEPFSVITLWEEAETPLITGMTITVTGEDGRPRTHAVPPPAPRPAGWSTHVSAPQHEDWNENGESDRSDRNHDALQRQMALSLCNNLAPPQGMTWSTELEPDPDPARAARNRRLAGAMTNLIFGGPSPRPEAGDRD